MNGNDTIWTLLQPYLSAMVRHGLTAGAVFLAAKGLPMLGDSAIAGLTVFVMGAAGMGWSLGKEWLRRQATAAGPAVVEGSKPAAGPSVSPLILLPIACAAALSLSACGGLGGVAVTASRAVLPAADMARIEKLCRDAGPGLDYAAAPGAPQSVRDVAVYPAAYCRELAGGSVPATTDSGTAQWLPAVLSAAETAARVAGVILPLVL